MLDVNYVFVLNGASVETEGGTVNDVQSIAGRSYEDWFDYPFGPTDQHEDLYHIEGQDGGFQVRMDDVDAIIKVK